MQQPGENKIQVDTSPGDQFCACGHTLALHRRVATKRNSNIASYEQCEHPSCMCQKFRPAAYTAPPNVIT